MSRALLAVAFLGLFLFAACLSDGPKTNDNAPSAEPPSAASGSSDTSEFPVWFAGNDCSEEPPIQTFEHSDGFHIIRLSKCLHFEAPFVYLLFGTERALLWDTGASAAPLLLATVDDLIAEHCRDVGIEDLPLVVGHSHGHGDHVAGDSLFAARPNTTLVRGRVKEVCQHYGIENWPEQIVQYDLGDRVLDLIPTPGHHNAHLALYDRTSQLLISGDTFYPGFLFVFRPNHWNVFRSSSKRLLQFVEANPVKWLLGCHIEISATGESYDYGTWAHPNERVLQLDVEHLRQLNRSLDELGDEPAVKAHRDFVIYPVWIADRDG